MDDQFPRKFGNYHLLAPLAQGGMGALYLAVKGDRGLERLLVIKTVLPHLADAEYIARFRDEAKVVVKLSHGNLIPVFDAGTVDGELFLAMDFVEGRDLRAVWNRCAKKQVAFPIDVAVYLIKELCRGLAYAHSFGGLKLVHRDVSPPNILISYSGEVKVTDFGLASSTLKLEKTAPGIIYGKVAYMSPEQARGEPLDGRSDLYAAAIVLWELLTGRQLYPPGKDQPHDLIQRARNPVPMAPSKRAPRVPPALDAIVLRGLAPERDERYADGEEFRQALADWLVTEAPGTDAARLETFLSDLFAEDIERERAEREILLEKMRKRVATLPPTDEMRKLLAGEDEELDGKLMRAASSRGRRAADHGEPPADRRQIDDRRRREREDAPGDGADADSMGHDEVDEQPRDGREAIGTVIDGRYRILDLIGAGGMGRVYLAEHIDIGRRVAIKILHQVYSRMPDLVERFRREARAASKIGNPHIVDVTDSGTTRDRSAYFVMEYLEGEELSAIIAREGALDITRSLRVAAQICRALAAAHDASIIHRDLKPENIFITSHQGVADFVKVLDFGVATSTETDPARAKRLTTPGMAMGTPEYMAPEQAAGRPADERCDVYSVGAILYEALTGAPPYQGDNFMEILTKKATVEPIAPRKLRPELSPEVSALVMRAMARVPEQRPASMEVLEYELTKCLEGRGTAVAKMLGISADPALVPGPAGPAQGERAAGARAESPSGVTGDRPARAVESAEDAGEDPFEMDVVDSTETFPRPYRMRSRWILIGFLALAGVLVIGVGTVMMVAGSDGGAAHGSSDHVASAPADAAASAHLVQAPDPQASNPEASNPKASDPIPPVATPDAAVVAVADEADAAVEKPATNDTGPRQGTGDRGSSSSRDDVPRTLAEARSLIDRARELYDQGKWSRARRLYAQVARSSFLVSEANLGLADTAFQMGDDDGTIRHATRALRHGGGTQARLLLGRAFYKKGRYADALRYYDAVLKSHPNHREASAAAKRARELLNR